jgi:hypothetical protein
MKTIIVIKDKRGDIFVKKDESRTKKFIVTYFVKVQNKEIEHAEYERLDHAMYSAQQLKLK